MQNRYLFLSLIFFASLILSSFASFSQVPQAFNYQTVVRDPSGVPWPNHNLSFRFTIFDSINPGTLLYREVHSGSTNAFGLFMAQIGLGTDTLGSFSAINWVAGSKYLEVEVDINQAGNYIDMGTSQLLSVPYAMYAQTAGNTIASTHAIGDYCLGGIVFYVYDNGHHGLIADSADLYAFIQWHNYTDTLTNAVKDGINSGAINNERIINMQGVGTYAAQVVAAYQGGGFGDWYLPSKYELNLLYQQQAIVGGFSTSAYWSSTESGSSMAWSRYFNTGSQAAYSKSLSFSVRAIRAF